MPLAHFLKEQCNIINQTIIVMLGAIIGDIVGSRWEFDPTNDYDFEMFSEENSITDIPHYFAAKIQLLYEISK